MIFFGSKDIKDRVKDFIEKEKNLFSNKIVIDLPAGSGETSKILMDNNAKVIPYDLFPEFFKEPKLKCNFCDLTEDNIGIPPRCADVIFCQEGIEHIPDQLKLFQNFNKILNEKGKLFLTTPNLSNLRGKISFLLHESEYYYKIMPPNELDSIWFGKGNKLYFGHVFLINIQKMRLLAKISGFKMKRVIDTKINYSALFLLLFFYPFILFISTAGYIRALKKQQRKKGTKSNATYLEILKLNLNLNVLLGNHLFLEFEKEHNLDEVALKLDLFEGKEIVRT